MQQSFFIRCNGNFVRIRINDIIYVESLRNYIKIHCRDKNYLVLISLKSMMEFLPESSFHRIHKSYIISLDYLTEFNYHKVMLGDIQLPVGENKREGLAGKINIFDVHKGETDCFMSLIGKNGFKAMHEKTAN